MDSTYAPQSPDLSGFLSSPNKQPLYQPSQSSYAPRSPVIPSYNNENDNVNTNIDIDNNQPHHQSQQYPVYDQNPPQNQNLGYEYSEYASAQHMPPIPALPASHSFGAPPSSSTSNYYQQPQVLKAEPSYPSSNFYPVKPEYIDSTQDNTMSSRAAAAPAYKNPNPTNIEIKTKFPVARIKRIMQADEEVGKVAQVTPVAVNKALELFMIALVTGAAARAKDKGGKRVTAQHLKAVVEGDEQFDFLKEIVERVADVQENAGGEGKKKRKEGAASDSDEESHKPKKGKGRRKKSDD